MRQGAYFIARLFYNFLMRLLHFHCRRSEEIYFARCVNSTDCKLRDSITVTQAEVWKLYKVKKNENNFSGTLDWAANLFRLFSASFLNLFARHCSQHCTKGNTTVSQESLPIEAGKHKQSAANFLLRKDLQFVTL